MGRGGVLAAAAVAAAWAAAWAASCNAEADALGLDDVVPAGVEARPLAALVADADRA